MIVTLKMMIKSIELRSRKRGRPFITEEYIALTRVKKLMEKTKRKIKMHHSRLQWKASAPLYCSRKGKNNIFQKYRMRMRLNTS